MALLEYKSAFLHLFWGLTAQTIDTILKKTHTFWLKIILTFVYVLSSGLDFDLGLHDDWQFHSFSLRSNLKTEIEVFFSPFISFFFRAIKRTFVTDITFLLSLFTKKIICLEIFDWISNQTNCLLQIRTFLWKNRSNAKKNCVTPSFLKLCLRK